MNSPRIFSHRQKAIERTKSMDLSVRVYSISYEKKISSARGGRRSRADRFVLCQTGLGRYRHRMLHMHDLIYIVTLSRPPPRTPNITTLVHWNHLSSPLGSVVGQSSQSIFSTSEFILSTIDYTNGGSQLGGPLQAIQWGAAPWAREGPRLGWAAPISQLSLRGAIQIHVGIKGQPRA